MIEPASDFEAIVADIRKGPDPFDRRRTRKSINAAIGVYSTRFPRQGKDILEALLNYYFPLGRRPRAHLVRVLRRAVLKKSTQDWLRLRSLLLLAGLTYKDPRVSIQENFRYRRAALRLARLHNWQKDIIITLNNWVYAMVELRRVRAARALIIKLTEAFEAVKQSDRRASWYAEARGRFSTHEAKLLFLESQGKSLGTKEMIVTKANRLYERALRLEGADTNRRVNILIEWANALLELSPDADSEGAIRILGRASRSIDSRVSDLNRAYFYHVHGRAYLTAARRAEHSDLELATVLLRTAREELKKGIQLYRKGGHQLEQKSKELLGEVDMKLAEYQDLLPDIKQSLARFRQDHPDASKTAFIMMPFGKTRFHARIFNAVKKTFRQHGLQAIRADERVYHDSLLTNVLTYSHGCGMGVAIFERIESNSFNPNVALEVGYMLALKKPVCLLKEETLQHLHTDLLGRLYQEFNIQDVEGSIARALSGWLRNRISK